MRRSMERGPTKAAGKKPRRKVPTPVAPSVADEATVILALLKTYEDRDRLFQVAITRLERLVFERGVSK